MSTVFTLGHSSHSWQHFQELVADHDIGCIVDVRSSPYSRWSHFSRPDFRIRLNEVGVCYVHLGELLGGRPQDSSDSYATMSLRPGFGDGIQQVLRIAERCRVALVCAEHDPLTCHRFHLVARQLARQAVSVTHILRDGSTETNEQTEDRLIAMRRKPSLVAKSRSENLVAAYDAHERKLLGVK